MSASQCREEGPTASLLWLLASVTITPSKGSFLVCKGPLTTKVPRMKLPSSRAGLYFLGLLKQSTTRGVASNNRKVSSHGSGSRSPKSRCQQEALEALKENRSLLLPASGGCDMSWFPRLVAASLQVVLLLLCVCLLCLFSGHFVIGFKARLGNPR